MIVHPPPLPPAVIVHGLADARTALAVGMPVTLLSAPGAAAFAGCLWWREMVTAARAACPATGATDILDCADAPGLAMAALRGGVCRLVLSTAVPAWGPVRRLAEAQGGFVLADAPPALDLGAVDGAFRLRAWLNAADSHPGNR
ncbi:hypothetical protein [Rhodopila sp.]|uniref:hypothetical protein n=1 Tax=Rhodopila sp. TaxID=2480087 RepID=UPI002C18BDFB|nr:hypothetical protein [Rhodopila sp.]HVZ08524.1 hypothetical protein [Rhodopila sp.]